MTSQGVFPARPRFRPVEPRAGEWSARPKYALGDIPALLWRERRLMLAVFIGVAALGVGFAFTLKTVYPAHSSVLVSLGQEYVYEPRAGDAGRGAAPDDDRVLRSEAEIIGSDAVKERVVRRLGVARLAPGESRAYAAGSPEKRDLIEAKLADQIGRSLKIDTAPDAPVIRLTYENRDPELAALVLNTLLEEYLVYRRTVLLTPTAGALDDQRRAFEQRLAEADAAYQNFLSNNQIGDFEAEKTSLSQLSAQLEQQQYASDSSLKEKQGRLAAIDSELAQLPSEVGLYHDTIAAGETKGRVAERSGVNPVYQTFQTEKLQLTAEVAALRDTAALLTEQMAQLTERRLRLAQLEPQYDSLSRDRDVLQSNVRDFTLKAEQSRASQEIAEATNDNLRFVERAGVPTGGKSLRRPVLALALLFAGFTALGAGFLRLSLRPGIPTPASAARTLDLPVLGSAGLKQPA